MQTAPVGRRIAAYRRRRGLSQATLAGLVGRSESWLSQVERGVRSVDRLSVLLDMAKVLHVDVESLTGKTWDLALNGNTTASGLTDLRRAFTRYGHLLGDRELPELSAAELKQQLNAAHSEYQAARYSEVISRLPRLLSEAERQRAATNALLPYVSAHVLGAKLTTKLGVTDLALLAAHRAASAAFLADSPVAIGISSYQVACAMLRADQAEDAEHLSVGMAEKLIRDHGTADPLVLSAAGALWLISAVIAARKTERQDSWDRLDQAERLAASLGEDGNYAWTAFGPTNVAMHRISVAAELGDAGEALRAAHNVDEDRLPSVLLSRRAQIQLDLAWAQSQRRQDAEATLHLLEAERIAPEIVRHNVIAQEIIREMLSRGNRSKTRALADLARRAGLMD